MTGKVVHFSDYKGFGFIKGSDDREYFVHVSQICQDGYKTLELGQSVMFKPIMARKGIQAHEVYIVEEENNNDRPIKVSLKKNPFTPQTPVIDPKKFAGRRKQVAKVVSDLFNGNNVLIHGPRGIGKSSISYQIYYMTQGDHEILDYLNIDIGDYRFNYLTGDHRCTHRNSLVDVCSGLICSMKANCGDTFEVSKKEKSAAFNFNFINGSEKDTLEKLSPSDLAAHFALEIEGIYKSCDGRFNGMAFLIDEIDVLDKDIPIAPFLKSTVEKLQIDYHDEAAFIISGISGTTTRMLSEHASSSRLLEKMEISPMPVRELNEILDRSLAETGVTITDRAKEMIVNLSNNFPHPVQLIGYHAFNFDSDNKIDNDDVAEAKQYIIENTKKQEFNTKFESIVGENNIEIIRIMASSHLDTVDLNYLKRKLPHLSDRRVTGGIGRLHESGIVEKIHAGTFRFQEPLFKTHLQWVFGIK